MVDKNKSKFDINTMDIKSHLDASFDIDDITISEELIARTLKAVNNSENVTNFKSKKKKLRFSPIKIATVTAAVFVFAVGIYAMNNGISKKDSESNRLINNEYSSGSTVNNDDSVAYDKMEDGNAKVEGVFEAEKENTELDSADYGITADDKSDELAVEEHGIMDKSNQTSKEVNASIISNLYPTKNKTISEFKIKDEKNKLIREAKQIEDVKKVYEILDEYPLTQGENKTLEYIYQFDILTDDGQSYTILVGSGICAKTSDELEYTYYEIDNSDELLGKIEDFISTMP